MVRISSSFSEADLTRYLQIALDLFRDLQFSLQPRFHLEIGLLKMIQAGNLVEIEQALADLGPVERVAALSPVPPRAPIPVAPPRPSSPPQRTGPSPFELDTLKKTGAAPVAAVKKPAPLAPLSSLSSTGGWREKLHAALNELSMPFTADAVEHSQFTESDGELKILTPQEFSLSMKKEDIQKAIAHLQLPPQRISISFGEPANAGPALEKKKTTDEDEVTTRALSDPEVKNFIERFGGEVRAVRNLKE